MWAFLRWLSTLCFYDLGIRTVSSDTLKQLCNHARKYPFPHPKTKGGNFCFRPTFLRILSYPPPPGISHNHYQGSVADPEEGPGGANPPLLLDQNEARRAEKSFFEPPPPPPPLISGSGWPPRPLSEGLDLPLGLSISTDGQRNTSATLLTEVD